MASKGSGRGGSVRIGALMVLAVCFVASALVRVGDVVAALPDRKASSDLINEAPNDDPDKAGSAKKAKPAKVSAPQDVIAELKRQRELLDAREAELAEREQQLKALNKRMKDRLEELKSERKRLEETAVVVNDAAGKDVRRLAAMYEQMKPKQAALIFDKMAPSFAAGFLSEMRPEAAAPILQNMQAEKAYAVSLMLAGRNIGRGDDADGAGKAPEAGN